MPGRSYPEAAEQMALVEHYERYCNAEARELIGALVYTPNDELRDPRRGAKAKKMGLVPGQPDLTLYISRKGHGALLIEMKSATGRTSPKQDAIIEMRRAQGYRVEVCRGFLAAWAAVADYLDLPPRWHVR